jgi:hypothetical protein
MAFCSYFGFDGGACLRESPIEEARLKEKVEHLARRVFASAGARDYGRRDILLAGIAGNAETGHAFIPIPREMEKIFPGRVYEKLSR